MADKKISALTAATTPLAGTEVLPIVQGGATVKVSVDNLTTGKPVSMSNLTYTGTLTGGTGVVNLGSGQVYKDASGNVGIDTSSPAYRLQVRRAGGAGSLGVSIDGVGSVQRVAQYFAVGDSTSATTGHAFYTRNGTATDNLAALIDSSGNLQVGTTSGDARVSIVSSSTNDNIGSLNVKNTNAAAAACVASFITATNSTATSNSLIKFTIDGGGSGSGQINANGASQAAFGSFSDRRLKENIGDLPPQLANIMALRPVEFDYIQSEGGGHQIGFIAQEMQEVYADAVGERPDGMLTVTGWNKTEAILVKAIQEQQAIITQLQADVAALKGN